METNDTKYYNEGTAKIEILKDATFINEAQSINRDLSIVIIKAFSNYVKQIIQQKG